MAKLLEATGHIKELEFGAGKVGNVVDPKRRGVFRIWYAPDPGEVVLAEGKPVQRNVKVELNLTEQDWKALKKARAEGREVRLSLEVVDGE